LTSGTLANYYLPAFCIAGGAVAGAQIGARVSRKVKGSVIMIFLAVALILAGVRIFISGISA